MTEVLASLARGELFQPLRSIVRPPGAEGLFGLMPAYRGEPTAAWALRRSPSCPPTRRGGSTRTWEASSSTTARRRARRDHERLADHGDPYGSGVGRRHSSAGEADAQRVAILGSGAQARGHVHAMRAVLDDPEIRIWSRNLEKAEELAGESRGDGVPFGGRRALRRRGRVHDDRCDPARRGEALARTGRARERGRLVLPEHTGARHRDGGACVLLHDRRESCLNEAGDYILAAAEGAVGPEHIKAELGEVLAGLHPGREHEDELTVFESLGIAVEDLASAELVVRRAANGAWASRSPSDPTRRDRGRARADRRRRGSHPLIRLHVDDAPAEIWLKLENLQPIGSFKIRGAGNAVLSAPPEEVARGLVTTSTGNMAQGIAWMARELGVPATIIAPHNSSPSKLAAVESMGGRIVHVTWTSGGPRWRQADWTESMATSSSRA